MLAIEKYRAEFIVYMKDKVAVKDPINLYEPISYILGLGGKRLRPVLTLMAAEIFGSDYKKAMDAALAIEVFHNFSLVHDDIMDDAPLRRGLPSVHEKWDINTGILSGDAMLILAYQLFENYEGDLFRNLAQLFSKTAREVCEGQQYDLDFETRDDVTIAEYLKMIEYKTAVLVGAALKMGALIAGSTEKDQNAIYEFGRNLGIAFQLKDDYLDAFGDPKTFGKQVGGDIIQNKKTFLFLKAVEVGTPLQKKELQDLISLSPNETSVKVASTKEIFMKSGAAQHCQVAIESHTNMALTVLQQLDISETKKVLLKQFAENLMQRAV